MNLLNTNMKIKYLYKMATINRQEQYDPLDTEAKRRVRQKIDEILTPELRHECNGLAITVLTIDEYQIMLNALRESSDRKKQIKNRRRHPSVTPSSIPLTLNINREVQSNTNSK